MKTFALRSLCFFLLFSVSCIKEEQPSQPSPPDVVVYQAEAQEVPIYKEFVGQISGFKDIAIRARVEGYLEGIHFQEGSRIEKDTLLYTLESQPFVAEVAAQMSKLAEARTMLTKAESDLRRIKPLAAQKAVSESDLDSAVALQEASVASVEAAEANLHAAKIQLGYTKIYSPISGIIGRTTAKVGDFVGRSPNPIILNTVSRIDSILVQFFITETQYLLVARDRLSRKDPTKEDSDQGTLELILADGSLYPLQGKFDFADREVNPTTGAMMLQASFPNPDELLRPGQFAKIKAMVALVKDAILIPQRSVTEIQGLYSVFVVDHSNRVERRGIEVGPRIREFWLIKEGLEAGEKVIYEGLQKVKEGITVKPTVKEIKFAADESK